MPAIFDQRFDLLIYNQGDLLFVSRCHAYTTFLQTFQKT